MESVNVSELVERLGSDEDAVRKMAVFKLQSNIGDPSFAEVFISEGGLTRLRFLTLNATGNTLAYSLTSFSRLLEVDKGWEYVDKELVEKVQINPTRNGVNTDESFTGRGARGDASSRQHPSRRNVDSRLDRFTSPQSQSDISDWALRISSAETCHCHLPTIPRNARKQTVIC